VKQTVRNVFKDSVQFRWAFVNATLKVLPFDTRVVIFAVNAVYSNGKIDPFNTTNSIRFAGTAATGGFAQTGFFKGVADAAAAGRRLLQAGGSAAPAKPTITGVDVWYGVIALVPHARVQNILANISTVRQMQIAINTNPAFVTAQLQLPRFFDTAAPSFAPTPLASMPYPQFVAVIFGSLWGCVGVTFILAYWRYQHMLFNSKRSGLKLEPIGNGDAGRGKDRITPLPGTPHAFNYDLERGPEFDGGDDDDGTGDGAGALFKFNAFTRPRMYVDGEESVVEERKSLSSASVHSGHSVHGGSVVSSISSHASSARPGSLRRQAAPRAMLEVDIDSDMDTLPSVMSFPGLFIVPPVLDAGVASAPTAGPANAPAPVAPRRQSPFLHSLEALGLTDLRTVSAHDAAAAADEEEEPGTPGSPGGTGLVSPVPGGAMGGRVGRPPALDIGAAFRDLFVDDGEEPPALPPPPTRPPPTTAPPAAATAAQAGLKPGLAEVYYDTYMSEPDDPYAPSLPRLPPRASRGLLDSSTDSSGGGGGGGAVHSGTHCNRASTRDSARIL
jgi:hypothetical protein